MAWLDASMIHYLGLTLLHFLWQGAVIGALYGITVALLRPTRSTTRYKLGVLTLLALALAPVATLLYLVQATPTQAAIASTETLAAATLMVSQQAPSAGATLASLLPWIVAGWLAGVAVLSLRLTLAWRSLVRLKQSADYPGAAFLLGRLESLKRSMGVTRRVTVALTNRISSPLVIGWLRPVILLPPSVVCGLPMRQVEMILAHELAHIRRYDHLVNLFQILVETLLFYHPVVLWVSRRIRIERENACDDLAVRTTENRLDYVEMLAALENFRQHPAALALAINDGQILSRIRRLVQQPPRPRKQRGVVMPAVVAVVLAAGAGTAALWPDADEDATDQIAEIENSIEPISLAEPARNDAPPPVTGGEPVPVTAAPDETTDSPAPEPTTPETEEPPAVGALPEIEVAMIENIPALVDDSQAREAEPGTSGQLAADPAVDEVAGVPSDENSPAAAPTGPEEMVDESGEIPESQDPAADATGQPATMAPLEGPKVDPDRALAAVLPPPEAAFQAASIPESPPPTEPEPLTGGQLIEQVAPDYPYRARRSQSNGTVELKFLVTESGTVEDVQVIGESPHGMDFGKAAREAVAQWRFEPFLRGDDAVSHRVQVEVDFDLDRDCKSVTGTRIPRC